MNPPLDKAFGYRGDKMNLPVPDVTAAVPFYETVLGFRVVSRSDVPHSKAVLARDGVEMALAQLRLDLDRLRADLDAQRSSNKQISLYPSDQLAEQLGASLGRPLTAASVSQTLHRARVKFAALLVAEVARSLETVVPDEVEQELLDLDLLRYCRPAQRRRRTLEAGKRSGGRRSPLPAVADLLRPMEKASRETGRVVVWGSNAAIDAVAAAKRHGWTVVKWLYSATGQPAWLPGTRYTSAPYNLQDLPKHVYTGRNDIKIEDQDAKLICAAQVQPRQ